MGGLRIEVADDFTEMEDAWRLASTHSAGYVFQCYDWLALWHATAAIGERTRPLLVRVADPAGRTVLFLPLGIMRSYGCRVLVFLGGGVTDYKAPLIDRAFAASCGPSDFADLWREILHRLPPADLVWLELMPEKIEDVQNPMATLRHSVHTQDGHAATPLPATFEAFKDARGGKMFTDAARRRRKLAALGSVNFEVPVAPGDILGTVEIALTQKRRRSRELGWQPLGAAYEAFYRQMATSSFDRGRPHVSRLRVGDAVVATHVGAVHGSRFYHLVPSYEGGEWARYSPGRLLQQELVKWCISEGLETFDMTVGDEAYKRFWVDTSMALYRCRYALTPRGHVALALLRAKEQAKKSPQVRALVLPLKQRLSIMRRSREEIR